MRLSVDEIVKATGAQVVQGAGGRDVTSVSIDTRTMKAGDLFIAIKGPHFDGHDFIDEAIDKGACGVVISGQWSVISGRRERWVLQVNDTTHALGDIASMWRKKVNCTVIAVTGSNGKSTTKEMIAAGLSETRKVKKTEGNFNNLIGLPLQVLDIMPEHEVAVLEMGMSAEGEIRRLTKIANPDIGLITNVNPAHLEKLHTVENVAHAKGELFETMRADGAIVINAEDAWASRLGEGYQGKKVSFGMQNGCDVQFGRMISEGLDKTDLTFYVKGREYAVSLNIPGVHNVMNALASFATGLAYGVSPLTMIPGLEKFSPMKMRMERIQLSNGVQLINDSYNANPSSMNAALRTVCAAKKAGRFIAVLGDMLELGETSSEKHKELGQAAADYGVSKLFVIGSHANDVANGAKTKGLNSTNIVIGDDVENIKRAVLAELKTGDVVLVKGSRGMKMERVVEFIKDNIGA